MMLRCACLIPFASLSSSVRGRTTHRLLIVCLGVEIGITLRHALTHACLPQAADCKHLPGTGQVAARPAVPSLVCMRATRPSHGCETLAMMVSGIRAAGFSHCCNSR